MLPVEYRRGALFCKEFYDIRIEKILFFKDLVAKFTVQPELFRQSVN